MTTRDATFPTTGSARASFRSKIQFTDPIPGATACYDVFSSPVGTLLLLSDGASLTALHLPAPSWQGLIQPFWRHDAAALQEVRAQLRAYFARELFAFELTVAITGTAFQRAVWRELNAIGYGQTASYRDIAVAVGRPRAVRAVGGANHVNPVPIVIPCHRVVGANGSLTGYGGGLDCKLALLELEQPERAAVSPATSS